MHSADPERTATLGGDTTPRPNAAWTVTVAHHPQLDHVGRRMVIEAKQSLQLGRGGDALGGDVLDDEHLSRRHLQLEIDTHGGLLASDSGSRNGTYVNGAKIEMARICAGDVIGLGRMLLVADPVEPDHGETPVDDTPPDDTLVGGSGPWSRCLASVARVAPRPTPVLLWGPTGSGKDRLAQRIHATSGAVGPLVSLRCGSTSDEALAPRGSTSPSPWEAARDGTVYLDGVDDASATLQAMLLELLEHGRLRRHDTGEALPLSTRVVASTSQDPRGHTRIRDDLLHRLAGWTIAVPPLRTRRSDIAELLVLFARRYAGPHVEIDPEFTFRLLRYGWPGNVRQLEAVVERAVVERTDDAMLTEFPELDEILLRTRAPAAISTMSHGSRAPQTWVVAASGQWFRAGATKHSLARRKTLARLLSVMVEAWRDQRGTRLSVADLLVATWPEQRFEGSAGSNRVYVALAALRKLGLRDIVVRTDGGYMIDPNAQVQIVDG